MNDISRRAFLMLTAGMAAKLQFPAVAAPDEWKAGEERATTVKFFPAVNLRGYGQVSAEFTKYNDATAQASLMHIRCISVQKAQLVQAKYLSDLMRLPGISTRRVRMGGVSATVYNPPGGGAITCFSSGLEVKILASSNPAGIASFMEAHLPGEANSSSFLSHTPVPMYLDRFDRFGLLYYYGPWSTPQVTPKYDYSQDLEFVKKNDTGLIIWDNTFQDDTGEGMTDTTWWDWLQTGCKKQDIPLHINLSLAWPMLWLGNRYREETMLKAPQFVGGFYGVAHDSCGVGAISWHSKVAEAVVLGICQSTVRRFVNDPNIVGWLEPHGETSELPQALLLESGPLQDQALREYLQEKYQTVDALSNRWWGDGSHYKSWSDIVAPELAEFVGYGPDAIDLQTKWRVKYLPAPDGHMYERGEAQRLGGVLIPTQVIADNWIKPDFDDSSWDTFLAPGNDRGIDMVWSPLVYRRTIDVSADWLASSVGVWLYLWVIFGRDFDEHDVYINGVKAVRDPDLLIAYDIAGMLKPGKNSIVMVIARGVICYRTYLSHDRPAQYPNLGKQKNARWVDFIAWTMNARAIQIGRGLQMIRAIDPNRPINVMAPDENAGLVKQVAEKFGGHFHNTGYAAGFWADYNPMLMRSSGLPSTAEPGNGAPDVNNLLAFWGRWLTEGLNGVHYFQHLGEVTWRPEILAKFLENRTMYEMIGKYHEPEAEVAVLFSTPNELVSGWPWRQNPTLFHAGGYWRGTPSYGLINLCPRDGISEEDFAGDNVLKYRAIIDSNTSITSDSLLAGIERWVRAGGVFITFGQTGRHTDTEPDTWPISRLSGYKVESIADWSKNSALHLATSQKLYSVGDWKATDHYAGLHMSPAAPDCEPLALWDDGSVAVGMRPLGKGWIVTFGPEINGNNSHQYFGPVLTYFGINRRVPCSADTNMHFRHYIGNTGLHDIWVLFNESNDSAISDLTFIPGYHVPSMVNVVTGDVEEISRNDTGDTLSSVTLGPLETRMWISPRTNIAESASEWLSLQRGWWRGTEQAEGPALPRPVDMQRFSVDLDLDWRFKPADGLTDDEAAALMQPTVNDIDWERRGIGIWSADHPTVKRGVMRRRFTVPANWTDGYVGLSVSHVAGVFVDGGRIFVDGVAIQSRFMHDSIYLDSVNGSLTAGSRHLLALDIQSSSAEAGARGHAWLYYFPNPTARLSLAGSWDRFDDAVHQNGQVTLPGDFKGQFASRSILIDKVHANRNVLVYTEGKSVQGVLVNGKLIVRGSQQLFNSRFAINVTPYVNFGENNLIDLVCNGSETPIDVIELRYYDKSVYP